MRQGDILVSKRGEGYGLSKVLRITELSDGRKVAHILMYEDLAHRPALADLKSASVSVMHAPIDCRALETDAEVIGNCPVEPAELDGYSEYLKHTDFQAYAEEKGVSVEEVAARAMAAFHEGNRLCRQKRYEEAIEKYSEAIQEVPRFFEAHDNRALALMDLGRFGEAAEGFQESLQIEPNNPVALGSLGECRLKLGQAHEAVRILGECVSRCPDNPGYREILARAEALLNPPAERKKLWWPFR